MPSVATFWQRGGSRERRDLNSLAAGRRLELPPGHSRGPQQRDPNGRGPVPCCDLCPSQAAPLAPPTAARAGCDRTRIATFFIASSSAKKARELPQLNLFLMECS